MSSDQFEQFPRVDEVIHDPDEPGNGSGAKETRKTSRRRPPRQRKQAAVDTALVSRVVAAYKRMESTDEPTRHMMSALAGVSADSESLTVAALSGVNGADVMAAVRAATSADPIDALVATIEAGPERMRQVWALLSTLGAVNGRLAADSEAKMARRVVAEARSLDQGDLESLQAASDLLAAC